MEFHPGPEGGRLLSFDSAGVILAWDLIRVERNAARLLAEAEVRLGVEIDR
jgi:hypothetical protein